MYATYIMNDDGAIKNNKLHLQAWTYDEVRDMLLSTKGKPENDILKIPCVNGYV